MKDRLSEYRDAMNKSIFKNQQFTDRHKQAILAKINEQPQPPKTGSWFPRAASVAFVILFFIVGAYFLREQLELTPESVAEPLLEQTPTKNDQENLPVDERDEAEKVQGEPGTSSLEEQYNEHGDRIYSKEELANPKSIAYQIEYSEYESLPEYVSALYNNWFNENSTVRKGTDSETAEQVMASSSVSYINYFEGAIESKGMSEEFDKLQQIAFDLTSSPDILSDEEKIKEKTDEFEEHLGEIHATFKDDY